MVTSKKSIEFIQFSENAKYVGYGHLTSGKAKATFFNCETPYKKWEVSQTGGIFSVGFIKYEYAFMSSVGYSLLWDITKENEIYKTYKYLSKFPLFNSRFNSIIVRDVTKPTLVALDFNKILNSVSVDEIGELLNSFQTEYSKGILSIRDYETIANSIKLTINDIQGKVIMTTEINSITGNNRIELPIILPIGVYILQLKDGKLHYSQKFIVVE